MARPQKEIDKNQFEKLCGLQCTQEEICGFFGITDKTLNTWCKRNYNSSFSEVFRQKRGLGKISLRRSQWRLAEKNANMAIWLGKQYLSQTDTGAHEDIGNDKTEDALSRSLRELGKELESDD
jgi:hypothetical protein